MREVLLGLIWLRVLVVDDFPALEREAAKLLALKELPDVLAPELVEVEGRDTIDRLDVFLLDELLRVTLELLLVDGLEELILELLLIEGLEVLTLALLLVEGLEVLTLALLLVEGLEVLTLELLLEGLEALTLALLLVEDLEVLTLELLLAEGLEALTLVLLLVEGLDVLILELLLVEGLEVLTLELEDLEGLEDLEEPEDLEEEELLEADRLLPLDLLDSFAVTSSVSNIKAKVTNTRISLIFFKCFRVNMAFLLSLLALFSPKKPKILIKKRYKRNLEAYSYAPVPFIKGINNMSGNTNSKPKSGFFQYFMGAFGRPIVLMRTSAR